MAMREVHKKTCTRRSAKCPGSGSNNRGHGKTHLRRQELDKSHAKQRQSISCLQWSAFLTSRRGILQHAVYHEETFYP